MPNPLHQENSQHIVKVLHSGPAPRGGESVYIHDGDTECLRCGEFCVDRWSSGFQKGSRSRMIWKVSLSAAGVIVFGALTAMISPAQLWPILIPLTCVGWTFTVFVALNALRRVLGGRNPRSRREWKIAAKAVATQITAIMLFAAAPYISGIYEVFIK